MLMRRYVTVSYTHLDVYKRQAYDFADFLAAAGQKYWQLLPLGPTSYGDSPYQSFSSFAGNPYFCLLYTSTPLTTATAIPPPAASTG